MFMRAADKHINLHYLQSIYCAGMGPGANMGLAGPLGVSL
jgi:hypothetical protein